MCHARQYPDQMQCSVCGLAWDVGDPEPPTCPQSEPGDNRDKNPALKRHRFERWAVMERLSITPNGRGGYLDAITQTAWKGFCAAYDLRAKL